MRPSRGGADFETTRRRAAEILDDLDQGQVAAIYLLYGEDDFQRQTLVRRIVAKLLPEQQRDTQLTELRGGEVSARRVAGELESSGFNFGDEPRRVVLVRDCPYFRADGGDGVDLLHDRLEAGLLDDVTLIFDVDGAVDRRLRLAKLVLDRGVALEFPALAGEDDVARFLSARLRRAGKSMARAAVAALVERSGTDAQVLCHEVDKLIAYVGELDEITVADVREMVAPTVELSVFELVDAVAERRPSEALERLEGMLAQQAEPFMILAMLIRQFRLLVQARYLLDSGLVEPRLVRMRPFDFNRVITEKGDSGSLLDEWKARTAEILPPDAKQNLLGQHYYPFWKTLNMAQRLSAAVLEAALERLLQCDVALKSSHLDPRQEMELLAADLCTRMAAGATLDLETILEA